MAMQRNNNYPYSQHPGSTGTGQHRASSTANNNTSSAFSTSANPNEDWTKISDLAERRRIQNRIAQRNYRKKLKRRLEDLERKAASTSPSPEQSHAELSSISASDKSHRSSMSKAMARQTSQSSSSYSHDQQTSPELFPMDDQVSNFGAKPIQEISLTASSNYGYPTYSQSPDYFAGEYQFSSFQPLPHIYSESQYHPEYMQSLPPTLPSMMGAENLKQECYFEDGDMLSPFSMSYASLTGMNMPPTHAYAEFASRVNTTNLLSSSQSCYGN